LDEQGFALLISWTILPPH